MFIMENLILKKKIIKNGSKVYVVIRNNEVIETRISKNDYIAASVLFTPKQGYEIFFHCHTNKIGKGDFGLKKQPECSIGVAYLNQ